MIERLGSEDWRCCRLLWLVWLKSRDEFEVTYADSNENEKKSLFFDFLHLYLMRRKKRLRQLALYSINSQAKSSQVKLLYLFFLVSKIHRRQIRSKLANVHPYISSSSYHNSNYKMQALVYI